MSNINSPLDVEGYEEPNEEPQSKLEMLSNLMTSVGFSTKAPRAPGTLEYSKVYSDSQNRIGRVTVVIAKDQVGLEPEQLDYVTVTVQSHIPGRRADIEKAPSFCQADLLRVLDAFDEFTTDEEDSSVDRNSCSLCGILTAEYVTHEAQAMCLDCAKRKQLL